MLSVCCEEILGFWELAAPQRASSLVDMSPKAQKVVKLSCGRPPSNNRVLRQVEHPIIASRDAVCLYYYLVLPVYSIDLTLLNLAIDRHVIRLNFMVISEDDVVAAATAMESVMQDSMGDDLDGHNDEGATLDDGTGDDEPATKKSRTSAGSSPRERNKYKGMRIRQCLCGVKDCLPRLKGWIDLNDSKRQGFKELPRQSSKTTPVGLEKNRVRDIMFLHIKGHRSPKYDEAEKTNRERKLFVAFHHFHPAMLQEGNKGPYQYIHLELAERIGGFAECDTVLNLPGIVFHPIPNYPRELAERDFQLAGGIAHQRHGRPRNSLTSPPAKAKRDNDNNKRSRVRDVLGQMEKDPLKVANEYLNMCDRLKRYDEIEEERRCMQLLAGAGPTGVDDGDRNLIGRIVNV